MDNNIINSPYSGRSCKFYLLYEEYRNDFFGTPKNIITLSVFYLHAFFTSKENFSDWVCIHVLFFKKKTDKAWITIH